MTSKTRVGLWRHTQPKTMARMCTATNAKKTQQQAAAAAVAAAVVVVVVVVVVEEVAHLRTAEIGPLRPGYGDTAASTSCPCPTELGGD